MSKLLEVAIADARSLDRSLYRPFSREWHTKLPDGPCLICLAGSVIAGTFKASINSKRFPWSYDTEEADKLCAINSMRSGDWSRAFYIVYGVNPGARISQKLYTLRKPAHVEFNGWDEFHAHLDSLEALLPTLREIDIAAFAS